MNRCYIVILGEFMLEDGVGQALFDKAPVVAKQPVQRKMALQVISDQAADPGIRGDDPVKDVRAADTKNPPQLMRRLAGPAKTDNLMIGAVPGGLLPQICQEP